MRSEFMAIATLISTVAAPIPIAAGQDVARTQVAFSPELRTEFNDSYGEREAAVLEGFVERALAASFERHGAVTPSASLVIETTILDADPNRPTLEQMSRQAGLSALSISTGGAALVARIRTTDGRMLAEVEHRFFDRSLADLTGGETTWSSAHRAIRQWARKVAAAYRSAA